MNTETNCHQSSSWLSPLTDMSWKMGAKQLWAIWIPNPIKAVSGGWREIKGHCPLQCFQIFTYNLAQCSSVDILPLVSGNLSSCYMLLLPFLWSVLVGRFSFQPCTQAFSEFRWWWEYLPCRLSSHTAHMAETWPNCKKQCVIITSGFLFFTLLKKPLVSPTVAAALSLMHVSHFNSLFFPRYSGVIQKIYSPVVFSSHALQDRQFPLVTSPSTKHTLPKSWAGPISIDSSNWKEKFLQLWIVSKTTLLMSADMWSICLVVVLSEEGTLTVGPNEKV